MHLRQSAFSAPIGASPANAYGPTWLSLEEARAALEQALRDFWVEIEADQPGPMALAVRATVGIGKTQTYLKLLAESASVTLQRGHILVYVPTHDLAEEAEAAFRALHPGVPSMVLRGRNAIEPATKEPMCQKSDLADIVAKVASWGVTGILCQAEYPPGSGRMRRGPCRNGCTWFEQFPGDEKRVIFLPHAYLRSPLPGGIGGNVALRIIDEKFLGSMAYTQTLYVDEWLKRCSCSSSVLAGPPVCRHEARRIVHQALLQGRPIIPALTEAGLDRAALESFAAMEAAEVPQLEVTPWMAAIFQNQRVKKFDIQAYFAARARVRLWNMLLEDWACGISERINLTKTPCPGGPPRSIIQMHSCSSIPRDAPLILLDADADPLIVETCLPATRFVSIEVRPNAEVVQVEDQTFSDTALLTQPGSADRRREILDLVQRQVGMARHGVLLIATKAVLRQLHLDEDHEVRNDNDLMMPLRGAHPRWFGPGMQGLNAYSPLDTAIVLGRLQPPIEAIEDQMRALYGNADEPFVLIPAEDPTRGWYREADAEYLMADGTTRPAKVRTHPDPRGAAILSQMREASTLQAIGRIRAVNAVDPKRILILCSIPLPALPIDRLVLWQELVTGLSRLELSAKAQRLEAALYPNGQWMPVAGMRLSAEGIRSDAPEVFTKMSSGREWRRGLENETIFEMIRAIARRRVGRPVFITLKRRGGGRPTPAVLFDPPADLAAAVARLWPGLELDCALPE
jgi:hypothetical protein